MAYSFNPFTKKLDIIGKIPQYDTDPVSSAEDVWVKATIGGGSGGGKLKGLFGLGMPIVSVNTGGTATYALSFKTKEGTIKRVTLT